MILRFAFVIVIFSLRLIAEDFCALQVRVHSSSDLALDGIRVELLDSEGKLESSTETNRYGMASFCDFEPGLHSIAVTSNCLPVSVRNIRVRWNYTQEIKIIKPFCGYHPMGTMHCQAIVRVKSPWGPLANARVTTSSIKEPVPGDRYGRFVFGMNLGQPTKVSVSTVGYESTSFTMDSCVGDDHTEKTVVLKPK